MASRNEWEYRTLEIGSEGAFGLSKTSEDPESKLNKLGRRGWELTGQINMEDGATQLLILKRKREPDVACSECETQNSAHSKFCENCGNKLSN